METNVCEQCNGKLGPDAPGGMCPRCLMAMATNEMAAGEMGYGQSIEQTVNRSPGNDQPPKPGQIADLFPELELLDLIGHGGMGFVYKARQKNLGRIVAVKILSTNLMEDPAFAERFSREARAMAMMNHPNIIAIYDFGCRDNHYFLVMEYVDGLNLRQLVSTGEIKPADAIQLVPQLCDALQYAHDRGVVHRDIKPENVLISQEGQVKIADFGLAKLTNLQQNLTLTQTRQIMGTPNYMAPEQREKPIDVDHRADIYSLGVVIYELLTGELPLGRFAPPSRKAQVDARIDELVMRALEKEPNLRFQKISELKTGIESLSPGAGAQRHHAAHFQNAPAPDSANEAPMRQPERSRTAKVFSFLIMSFGIFLGIGGILLIVLSGVADDADIPVFNERILRVIGFSAMAGCGVVFALYGIFVSVFFSSTPRTPAVTEEKKEKPKPLAAIILSACGTIMGFVCAAFFTLGSFIPGVTSWQGGIGSALLAGCLFSIAELVEKTYDPSKKDEWDELLEPNAECPRCGAELKSSKAKQCFACGYDWH